MGARSSVYAIYYGVMTAVLFALTLYMWIGITPMLPQCSTACPVDTMTPSHSRAGTACSSATSYSAYYAAACFGCDGFRVTWPCPASAGIVGCSIDQDRLASACAQLRNASTLTGQPIVYDYYITAAPSDFARCARALGEPPTGTDATACPRCITAGLCVNAAQFEGPGMYQDGNGVRSLCYTVPYRIALRPVVVPGIWLFLLCYLFESVLLCTAAIILGTFGKTTGRDWAKLTLCQRRAACMVRIIPLILWCLNALLAAMLMLASILFWAFGVCTDALDPYGRPLLKTALSTSLIVSLVFFGMTCCGGGIMRTFIHPDAAFLEVPTLGETGTVDGRGRKTCAARCTSAWWCLRRLGP